MSGSDNPEFFAMEKEDDTEGIIKPMSENLGSCPEIVSEPETAPDEDKGINILDRADQHKQAESMHKKAEENDKATVSHSESKKQISEEEDDEGFKTPTSSDHRIPVITQCPPAPRKPLPQPSTLKRKASSPPPPGTCRSLQLDASTDVESIFHPINPNDQDDTVREQKNKKTRRDDIHQS